MAKKIILLLALMFFIATNAEAAENNNLPFEQIATTYSEGDDDALVLIKMKDSGTVLFVTTNISSKSFAFVEYSRELYDFYLKKDTNGGYSPLLFLMVLPEQERGQLDDDLGAWKEDVHGLPVYASFNVENGQVVCEKPFHSTNEIDSSSYQATIQNPNHERLIEIFMTHMPRLHKIMEAGNIPLP